MRILIAGAGTIGANLASVLAGEGQDIVVIDTDQTRLQRIEANTDCQTRHGDAAISGLMLVGSAVTIGDHTPPGVLDRRSDAAKAPGMFSTDLGENLAATLGFVRACTAAPLPPEKFATMVGYNMLVPPHIRQACRLRHEDYRADVAKLTVPALVLRGDADAVVLPPMGEQAAAAIPTARETVYPGIGHAPFVEAPERFNTDLSDFARQCHRVPA